MNCPQCKNLMVKAKATAFGEEYDYCRTCKKELKEFKVEDAAFNALDQVTIPGHWQVRLTPEVFEEDDLVTTPRYPSMVLKVVKVYPSYSGGYILECICNGNIYMLDAADCTNVGKMATIKP